MLSTAGGQQLHLSSQRRDAADHACSQGCHRHHRILDSGTCMRVRQRLLTQGFAVHRSGRMYSAKAPCICWTCSSLKVTLNLRQLKCCKQPQERAHVVDRDGTHHAHGLQLRRPRALHALRVERRRIDSHVRQEVLPLDLLRPAEGDHDALLGVTDENPHLRQFACPCHLMRCHGKTVLLDMTAPPSFLKA